jgi:hypothetical protein
MQAWWYRTTIPALRKQRKKGHEFVVRLSYIGRFYPKETKAGDIAQW